MKQLLSNKTYKLLSVTTLMICVICFSGQAWAKVKASVSQESYFSGDPITLIIETDKNSKAQPDLSSLKENFDVKGTSTSAQTNFINGSRSFKKIWKISLSTKATGKLTIPSIDVGSEQTNPIDVNVKVLPPEVAAETNKHIFIETTVDIDNDEIYVQQQIPYTIKFFYDAAMQSGEIILPEVKNANMRILGNEKKYQVVRAGNKYVVVEKRFVLSPEKSGKLIIPPSRVEGRIALTGGDSAKLRQRTDEVDMLNDLFFDLNNRTTFSNPFDPFFSRRSIGPTRPFSVSSEPIEINVLPVPESFNGSAWLPAEEIKMQDSWTKNPPELKLGEPVTRTIIMQVKGLASSQIPEIEIPKPAGMKIYPEQTTTDTPNDGNTIYGVQRVDISYIPDKTGNVVIPEISVDWWDVKTKQQKTYTLPAWNLTVAQGEVASSKNQEAEPQAIVEPIADDNSKTETTIEDPTITKVKTMRWDLLLTALAIGISLCVLFYFVIKRYLTSSYRLAKQNKQQQLAKTSALKQSLLAACERNDNAAASHLLLEFAKRELNDHSIQNLGTLVAKLDSGSEIIKQLDTSLYASESKTWKGTGLKALINRGLRLKATERAHIHKGLAPLYPD